MERRTRLARLWPVAGLLLLAAVFLLAAWLWISSPLLVNPWAVFEALAADSMPKGTVSAMAAMLPVAMLACLVILVAFVLLFFVAFSNEKRHIGIIRRLTRQPEAGGERRPEGG